MKYRIEKPNDVYLLMAVNDQKDILKTIELNLITFSLELDDIMESLEQRLMRKPRIDDFIPQQQQWFELPEKYFK